MILQGKLGHRYQKGEWMPSGKDNSDLSGLSLTATEINVIINSHPNTFQTTNTHIKCAQSLSQERQQDVSSSTPFSSSSGIWMKAVLSVKSKEGSL